MLRYFMISLQKKLPFTTVVNYPAINIEFYPLFAGGERRQVPAGHRGDNSAGAARRWRPQGGQDGRLRQRAAARGS